MKAILTLLLLGVTLTAQADPQLSSWYTANSSKYARITETDATSLAGTTETTWTRTSGPNTLAQTLPVYAGPQQIDYSASWVYVKTPDLATYVMGPWYDNAAKSALFINVPKNQNLTVRIPRTSTLAAIPATKTGTQGLNINGVMQDAIGFFVDGVAIFDPLDGFAYANGTEAGQNGGQWHRDAYVNESITFDKSFSHQQNTGKYHNHANPFGLRYQLGDNVTFNSTTKAYAEGDTTAPAKHSPIIGWMLDGLPLYGPYGYSSAMDATSGVRRMKSGYALRDGTTTGVDNITTAGRTLPAWALRNNGNTAASGPAVSTTYPLGRYNEDSAYLGDLIKSGTTKYQLGTDFDLNEYNVRYCVTPEFPDGTWAYFANIASAGLPQFPYMINRWFYGTPTGGAVTAVTETVTSHFTGGAGLAETTSLSSVNTSTGVVALSWTSVEGGTYKVEQSSDLAGWSALTSTQAATAAATSTSYADSTGGTQPRRFYKVTRTAIATYDGGGGFSYAAPAAATSAASGVGSTAATLNGSVTANGSSTAVTFQYGETNAYGSSVTAAQSPVTATAAASVAASLSSLTASTTYHFRVVAVNSLGSSYGSDATFTTGAPGSFTPPVVVTSAATNVATNTVTLNGTVNANSASTTTSFEYGTTTSYGGTASATPSSVTGTTTTSIAASPTGLSAGTTYHFRAKGVNSGGTTYGSDATFTTTALAAQGITSVSPATATHGTVVTLTITLNSGYNPPPPPTTAPPTSMTLTGPATVTATSFSRDTTSGVITATFTLPATTGSYTVNAVFGPNTWSLTNGLMVN